MKYIEDTLGVEVNTMPWDGVANLPYYLVDLYEFTKATIDNVPCVFMKPKKELDTLTALKKHMSRVHTSEPLPIILVYDLMTARRRKSLIEARIPFVAPPHNIYLPFLGVALNERYTLIKEPGKTLMPSSQLILFYYLYRNEAYLRTSVMASVFNISAMQVSRAVRQLTSLGLFEAEKNGTRIFISCNERRRDLFDKAKPYLLNPVRKKGYVEYDKLPTGLSLSGYSGLSELTRLSRPLINTFAFYGNAEELNITGALVDNASQAEVEIWRYNPSILSKHPRVVDELSLAVTLFQDKNPRVKQATDDLLSSVWR